MLSMCKGNAASVASSFRSSFEGIKLALIVGICGGVPYRTDEEKEILLSDVVISDGLIQYDFGRQLQNKFVRKDTLQDSLGRLNTEIRAFLAKLKDKGLGCALKRTHLITLHKCSRISVSERLDILASQASRLTSLHKMREERG
jgi:nucleoside phosphorylase